MNAKSLLCACFLLAFHCTAQEAGNASLAPSPIVKENTPAVELLDEQLAVELKSIEADNHTAKEYFEEAYKSRTSYYKETIQEGGFLFNSPVDKYVGTIYQKILAANGNIGPRLQLFISRSGVPNAYNSGDGNVVVNLGLLPYLDNEAQLAFVICHELAHQYFDHTKAHLEAAAKKFLNRSFRKEYNKALRSKYNVNAKLEALAIPGALAINRHSRNNESQADSMGLFFFSRTGYSLQEAVTSMDVLERCNRELDTNLIDFKKFMNTEAYPFQDSWLYYEGGSSLGMFTYEKWYLEDSLKTHPDTKERKAVLEHMLSRYPKDGGKAYLQPREQFRIMQGQAFIDLIHSYLVARRLDRPLFLAMLMEEKFPEQAYPRAVLCNSFALLSILQKQRRVNEMVELPSSFNEENYNRLLSMLSEMHSSDCASLAYALAHDNKLNADNEDVSIALIASACAAGKPEEYERLKAAHTKRFQGSRYAEELEFLDKSQTIKTKKK